MRFSTGWYRWGTGAAMVLTIAACLGGLPRLIFEPGLRLESGSASAADDRASALFPTPATLFLTVPNEGDPYTQETLQGLRTLVRDLEAAGLGAWRGPWSVVLPGYEHEDLKTVFGSFPSLKALWLAPGDRSWLLAAPSAALRSSEHVFALERWLQEHQPSVRLGGQVWYDAEFDRQLRHDAVLLFPLAILVLFVLFAMVTRTPFGVLSLGLGALMPSLGVLASFAWLGIPMGYASLLAPILVLALSTVYSLHGYHHVLEGGTFSTLWKDRGKAIFWSGTTAAAGFATLAFSPVTDLRRLGLVILLGIGLSFVWNLLLLPRFLERWAPRGRRPAASEEPRPTRPWARWVLAGVVALAVPGGILLVTGLHWTSYFSPQSSLGLQLGALEAAAGDRSPATLVLTWTEEGGWLSGDRWNELTRAEERWRREPGVQSLVGIGGLVSTAAARDGAVLDATSVAETLELLPRGTPEERLIDGRRSSVGLRFTWSTRDAGGAEGARGRLERLAADAERRFPGVSVVWTGPLVKEAEALSNFVEGQVWGMSGYFLMIAAFAWWRVGRFQTVLWILLPPLASLTVLLGAMGWLGWPLTPPLALVISELAGVGTDDALLWALLKRNRSLRRALLESTALLVGGLTVLLFSGFENIVRIGWCGMLALTFSTLVVVWVLPWSKPPSSSRSSS